MLSSVYKGTSKGSGNPTHAPPHLSEVCCVSPVRQFCSSSDSGCVLSFEGSCQTVHFWGVFFLLQAVGMMFFAMCIWVVSGFLVLAHMAGHGSWQVHTYTQPTAKHTSVHQMWAF